MTKLYLVRHGETFDNERQIMQGQTPGELNATGIRQAEALSLQLADVHFDAIIVEISTFSFHNSTSKSGDF